MTVHDFSTALRYIFEKLIDYGFSKHLLASVTLGNSRTDSLKCFLEGRDIGCKPLQLIFNDLGYDIHILPVKRSNVALKEQVDQLCIKSINDLDKTLKNYFDNKKKVKSENS